ncbi:hypothetical protein [Catellatospora sp. TT07R-123]|uniref:hypothetical protein n=1 Tax=Catellatospora sp. TT07R-123 TaxID=2733863 RepID=UPI001BB3AD74|nr:hypothetical protein [Catellatospora sp. TT07R-123]
MCAERADESHAHYADSLGYYYDLVVLAARDLTRAVQASAHDQPPGWHDTHCG